MCDQEHLAQMGKGLGIGRRDFARMGILAGAGATLSACTTPADVLGGDAFGTDSVSGSLAQSDVSFAAPGGTMDAFFVHPASGKHPAVILWPDIAGLRDAKKLMARQLAAEGFAVLAVNPYYRSLPAPQFADFDDWRSRDGMALVGPWRAKNTAQAIMETARAVAGWLDQQTAVDTASGIGNEGYCMGGPFTIWSAAGAPGRISAAASFHGGGLVGEAQYAPINMFGDLADKAQVLIAIAQNDDARAPDEKIALRATADAAGLEAAIEVYPADHGWCVPDSPVYNKAEADRAFAAKVALYRAAL